MYIKQSIKVHIQKAEMRVLDLRITMACYISLHWPFCGGTVSDYDYELSIASLAAPM